MSKNHLSIIIPVFNEAKNITILFDEIQDSLKFLNINYEVVFVNDFSDDNTAVYINQLINAHGNVVIINNKKNIGQSFSIIKGVQKAKFDIICTLDGDGQNNPKDIIKLYKEYVNSEKVKLVSGCREKRRDKINKIFASKVANFIRRTYLGDTCPDTGCSIKIFDKKIFLSFPFFDGLHRFISPIFELLNYKVCYLKVDHRPRTSGISKYNNFNRATKGIGDMIFVKRMIKKKLKIK